MCSSISKEKLCLNYDILVDYITKDQRPQMPLQWGVCDERVGEARLRDGSPMYMYMYMYTVYGIHYTIVLIALPS